MKWSILGVACLGMMAGAMLPAQAADIPYKPKISLKVGQSTVIKGVRAPTCGGAAPAWSVIAGGMPRSKLGAFSAAGTGTVMSRSCGGKTPALGVKFTAKTAGSERFTVFGDSFSVTVK